MMTTRNRKKNTIELDQLSEESRALYMLITEKFDLTLREMEARVKKKDEKIDMLERRINTLKSDYVALSDRLDEFECQDRRDMLVMSGEALPAFATGEDTPSAAADLLKTKLKTVLKPNDLLSAFRIGKKSSSQAPDKRNIVIKLRSSELKNDLLQSARRVKPQGLFLNENLTPGRSSLLYVLRRAKKSHPEKIDACGSHDGRVYVWVRSPVPGAKNFKVVINSELKLEGFLEKTIGVQMGEFLSKSDK